MGAAKVAISVDEELLKKLDEMVEKKVFPSRSKAVQEALEEKIIRLDKARLARECAKLDAAFEKELAEESLVKGDKEWPEY